MALFSRLHRRVNLLAVIAAVTLAAASARAYQAARKTDQPEARDPSGRVTVEAAVINVIQCNGPGENGGQYYVYQYLKRVGFRAIKPPNWDRPIGGQDFETFDQAALAACADLQ